MASKFSRFLRTWTFACLCLFCAPTLLQAAITISQHGSATAATATITSTAFGDLIVVCGNRASNTEPTVPTGYTAINHATGANTQSLTCAFKFSPGGDTSTGTMTNATNVAYIVARGYDINATVVLGCNPAQSNGSSTTLTYPSCTLSRTDGTSMLVTFGTATGATTTTPDVCPTGPSGGTMTLQSSTSQSTLALCTLIGVTLATTVTGPTISPTTGHSGSTFEIIGLDTTATSVVGNQLVQQEYSGTSNEACTGVCNLVVPLPNASLSGNNLKISAFLRYAGTAPTVSNVYCNADTGHATWTFTDFGHDVLDTTNTAQMYLYDDFAAAAGCKTITMVFSQVFSSAGAHASEWRQIGSGFDVAAGGTATSVGATAGALAATINGDIFYEDCSVDPVTFGYPAITNLFFPNNITSLVSDYQSGVGSYAFVQTTSKTYTPYMALTGNAGAYMCVAEAMKGSAGAGTAPSGIYEFSDQKAFIAIGAASIHLQSPVLNTGDAFAVYGNTGSTACTGQTDTNGNSFTIHSNSTSPQANLDTNSTPGNDWINLTGCPTGNNAHFEFIEVQGVNNSSHTSGYDTTFGFCVGSAANPNPTSVPGSCTAAGSGELVLQEVTTGIGPTTAVTSPTGAIYLTPFYTGWTDAGEMMNGGADTIFTTTSTGPFSWNFTNADTTSSSSGSALALLAAAGATTPPFGWFRPFTDPLQTIEVVGFCLLIGLGAWMLQREARIPRSGVDDGRGELVRIVRPSEAVELGAHDPEKDQRAADRTVEDSSDAKEV